MEDRDGDSDGIADEKGSGNTDGDGDKVKDRGIGKAQRPKNEGCGMRIPSAMQLGGKLNCQLVSRQKVTALFKLTSRHRSIASENCTSRGLRRSRDNFYHS